MPLKKKVRDIMIPLERYAVVPPDATLRDAVNSLRQSYCEVETGYCSESGPRTVLVVDSAGKLKGVLDFQTILKVLIPEVSGKLSQKLASLEVSVVFAEAGISDMDVSREDLSARVLKNAGVRVDQIMLKSLGEADGDMELIDALKLIFRKKMTILPIYESGKLIGVVRDNDLFLTVADIIGE